MELGRGTVGCQQGKGFGTWSAGYPWRKGRHKRRDVPEHVPDSPWVWEPRADIICVLLSSVGVPIWDAVHEVRVVVPHSPDQDGLGLRVDVLLVDELGQAACEGTESYKGVRFKGHKPVVAFPGRRSCLTLEVSTFTR